MPGLLIAAAVASMVSAASAAPAARHAEQKPRLQSAVQFMPSAASTSRGLQKVCGMPMVIGDASLDPGILVNRAASAKPDERRQDDDSSCGSVKLVKPVKRQR